MKVIHVVTTTESLIFLRGQASFMRGHGLDFHAVSSPGSELASFGEAERVSTHAVPMTRKISPILDLISVFRLYKLFRREGPDIVHTHTPKASLVANLAAWLAGVPVRIFHVHGLPHSTARGLSRTLLQWSTKASSALATEVLAVSRSVADEAVKDELCSAGVKVLARGSSNGVDVNRFCPAGALKGALRRDLLGLAESDLVLGFAGRLVRDKGIAELLAAWTLIRQEFPDAYLVLAGQPEERDALAPPVLQTLHSDSRVKMLGHFQDMPRFYACLDLLVLPTYREGLPTVILESAAMAVPAVASRCVGCVDAVEDGATGALVPAGDPGALADALRGYLKDPALRRRHGVEARARVLRDFRAESLWHATLDEYRRCMRSRREPRASSLAAFSRRCFDVTFASLGLLLLLPLLTLLAVTVRLSIGRPILFRQTRPGLHERPFELIKFRSMREALDRQGRPLPDSERLTPLGRFLRKTSLDELPELWNVLKGDMSLVGPRPLLTQYLGRYDDEQRRRHQVKPGITGWAQIGGRNALTWDEKLRLDVWYVEHRSFLLDLKILWRTFTVVLQGEGIAQEGHATMPEFGVVVKSDAK